MPVTAPPDFGNARAARSFAAFTAVDEAATVELVVLTELLIHPRSPDAFTFPLTSRAAVDTEAVFPTPTAPVPTVRTVVGFDDPAAHVENVAMGALAMALDDCVTASAGPDGPADVAIALPAPMATLPDASTSRPTTKPWPVVAFEVQNLATGAAPRDPVCCVTMSAAGPVPRHEMTTLELWVSYALTVSTVPNTASVPDTVTLAADTVPLTWTDPLTSSACAGAVLPTPTLPVPACTVTPLGPWAQGPFGPAFRRRSPGVVLSVARLLPPLRAHAAGPFRVIVNVGPPDAVATACRA